MVTTTNVVQGYSAQFVAEFQDINGDITIPSGATLSITYPLNTTTTTSTAITMTLTDSFYTATWASSVSALGLAPWTITSVGVSTFPTMQGTLRVITP